MSDSSNTNGATKTHKKGLSQPNRSFAGFFASFADIFGHRNEEKLTDPYVQNVYLYTAVRTIAKTIAAIPFKVWRDTEIASPSFRKDLVRRFASIDNTPSTIKEEINKDTVRNTLIKNSTITKFVNFEEVKAHPLITLLDQPNPHMTGYQLWEETISWIVLKGDCKWILTGVDEKTRIPREIWVTDGSNGWEAIVSNEGLITQWKYTYTIPVNGRAKVETFPAKDIIWFKNFNTQSQIKGLGVEKPLGLALEVDHEAQVFNRQFFKNGAVTDVVLETEQVLQPDQREAMLKGWNSVHQGTRKAFKTALLDGGVKARSLRSNHRDMEFRQLREMSRDEILAAPGVPKAVAGIIEDVNRATFLGSKRTFFEITLIPLLEQIATTLYPYFFKPVDEILYGFFDLSLVEGLRGDTKEKAELAKMYHSLGIPFNIINKRFDIGFDNIEHGDIGFIGKNTVEQIVSGKTLPKTDSSNPDPAGMPAEDPDRDDADGTSEDQGLLSDDKSLNFAMKLAEIMINYRNFNENNADLLDILWSFSNKNMAKKQLFDIKTTQIWSNLVSELLENWQENDQNLVNLAVEITQKLDWEE